MLKIRLQRVGRKNDPSFRVVVTDSRKGPKSSNYLEMLGSYNPKTDVTSLKDERIKHWMKHGAQVSDTVHNLLIKNGIIEGKKINALPKKSPIIKEEKDEKEKTSPSSNKADEVSSPDASVEASREKKAPTPRDEGRSPDSSTSVEDVGKETKEENTPDAASSEEKEK